MTKARDLANASTALGAVSATELAFLDGVTSAVQTQIDGKQAVNANVSTTELGYLDGVTSAIQTQLDAKTAKSTLTTTGDIYYASGANTPARLGIGSSAQVLTVASGIPSWATPAGGKVLQVVQATTATNVSIGSTSYTDTGLTGTITPTLASSKILVMVTQQFAIQNSPDLGSFTMGWKLARNIGGGAFSFVYTPTPTNNVLWGVGTNTQFFRALNNLVYLDSPATTSAVEYKLQARTNSTASGQSINFQMEDTGTSVIIMMEIGA